MSSLFLALSVALTLPYLAWGVYTLRIKFRYQEEFSLKVEAITLAAVAIFFMVELQVLRVWLINAPLVFLFAALGLFVSGTALYGPMLVSFASQLLVNSLMPTHHEEDPAPDFAPVDALERVGDHDAALQECLVIARVFPKDADVRLRVAHNMTELDRYEESTQWFESALERLSDPTQGLRVSNRLSDIYNRRLDRAEDARKVLERYLEKYPDSERSETVRQRIERLSKPVEMKGGAPTLPQAEPPGPSQETPSE
jgi:tetratricopeptide (TPR) repeat protein